VLDTIGPELLGSRRASSDRRPGAARPRRHADKGRLGANAILGVSLAVARAAADSSGLPLFRYVGGPNAHLLPVPDAEHPQRRLARRHERRRPGVHDRPDRGASFSEALRWGAETYHALKKVLKGRGLGTGVGDEGGYAPDLPSNRDALDLILEAITAAGFTPGRDIALALDVAATEFLGDDGYRFEGGVKTSTR
jgi:enolase